MKFDTKIIGYMNTFENYTRVHVKDCFFRDDELIYVVDFFLLGKVIGKNGENIKKLALKIKHKIRVIGFSDDIVKFVQNILYPLKGFEINREENKVIISTEDMKLKGKIFGRDRSNLKFVNEVVKRYFKDIEVIVR
ncbi:MAG: NusA-like transcription termination signal-binding factor [Nanoarchaeota archaeon]